MAPVLSLTPTDLEFGKRLADALKQSDFPYKGVFWLFEDQNDDWRLIVVTSLVEEKGRREAYLQLSRVTSGISGTDFQQTRITVMSTDDPLYRALHDVFAPAASVEGARLRNTTVNGIVVPEAYLYEIH
ncbi:MAG TPA: hypothetical protein VG897_17075 [Terriglobales bacterium]|nr:hypothetical protein [Terriglobales bacterium]